MKGTKKSVIATLKQGNSSRRIEKQDKVRLEAFGTGSIPVLPTFPAVAG